MTDDFHDFFVASAGVAGALIGLLFVAISVSKDRLAGSGGQVHRIRAAAALTSFTNSLVVSLFGLVPERDSSTTLVIEASVGLAFVAGAVLSLVRVDGWRRLLSRDLVYLAGLGVVFVVQLVQGIRLGSDPASLGAAQTIAVLVVICFLIGIARSWEVIGGPSVDLKSEIGVRVRGRLHHDDDHGVDGDGAQPPARVDRTDREPG